MKLILKYLIILTFTVSFLCSCKFLFGSFYSYSNIEDIQRLPIIEPYQIETNGSFTWFKRPFETNTDVSGDINGIIKIGLKDSVFVVLSDAIRFHSLGLSGGIKAWIIINFKTKTEFFCKTEEEYKSELLNLKIETVKLHNIDTLYSQFNTQKNNDGEWHLDSIK